MNLKPLPLFLLLVIFNPSFLYAQCDGSFLQTILFECDAPFDMDNRTTFNAVAGTWSGGPYITADGIFNPSGLSAGNYTITFSTDQGPCSPSTNFIVTVEASPEVFLTQNTLELCQNDPSVDMVAFEAANNTIPGFWEGPGISNNTTFNPSGLSGEIVVSFIAYCDNDEPTSCTPPVVPNPVCGCNDVLYTSPCAAELEGVISYTPWIPNFPPSCPSNSGCEPAVKTFTITVYPSTNAVLTTNSLQLCDNDAPINLNNYVAPSSSPGTWNVPNIFNPAASGAGNYFFEFTTGVGDCDDSATLSISVEEGLDVILTQQSLVVCSDQGTVNLNNYVAANSDSGTWNGTGVNPATGIFTITTPGTKTLSFSTGFDTCDDLETFVIVVSQATDAILTTNAVTICSNNGPLNLSQFVAPSSSSGAWTGVGVSNGIFNTAAGSQTLTFATPPGTCDDSATLSITVVPTPNAILLTHLVEVCFSDGILNLSAYVAANSANGIWAGQGVTSTTSQFDVSAGTQTITFTAINGNCQDVENLTIVVHPSPTAALTQNNLSVCSTETAIDLSAFLTPNTDSGNWTGVGILGNIFDVSFGSQTLTYTTNLGICDESVQLNIEVDNAPDVSTIPPFNSQLCTNQGDGFIQILNLNDLLTGDNGGTWTYSPVVNGFNPISVNTFNANGLPEATYTLTYSIDAGAPCGILSSSQTVEVIDCQLNCTADASFNIPSDLCGEANNTLDLNTLVTGNSGGVWTTSAPIGTLTGSSLNPTGLSGSFTITYTVVDAIADCPNAVQTANISIIAPPVVATNPPSNNFCITDTGFNLFELVQTNPNGVWSSIDAPNAIDNTGFFSFNGLTAGQYEVTYTVAAQAPCTEDAVSSEILILQSNDDTAGTDAAFCSLSTSLSAVSSEAGFWSVASTPSAFAMAIFDDENNPQSNVSVNEGGTYIFVWAHIDPNANACFDEDEVSIFFADPLEVNTELICAADNLTYNVSLLLSGGFAPYIVDGNEIAGSIYTLNVNDGEAYSLTVDDSGNCDEIEVNGTFTCFCPPPANPTAVANNLTFCEGTSIPTFSAVDNGTDTYNWYINQTDTEPIAVGINFTPSIAGTYWLEAVSPEGCASENRISVVLEEIPSPDPPQTLPFSTFIVQNQYFIVEGISSGGGTLNWYNDAGELVHTGLTYQLLSEMVGNFIIYVTETINGCESEPTAFNYTVNPFDIEECPNINNLNIPNPLHICSGSEINLSFLHDDISNYLRGEWTDLDGNVLSNDKTLLVSETVTGCNPVTVQYIAHTYCVINPVEPFDTDTATIIFYPFPQSATIVTGNSGCSVQIFPQPPCPNFSVYTDEDELVEGIFDLPLGSGTASFILANDDADAQGLFDCAGMIEYGYNCTSSDCPIISTINGPLTACSGEEVNLTPVIDDPNNQLDRVEWLLPDGSTMTGTALTINETVTGCDAQIFSYELRLYCSQNPNAIFDSRVINISIFPDFDIDLLTLTSDECMVPMLTIACDIYTIEAVSVPTSIEGGDSGTAIWTVSNTNNCFEEEVSIGYDCPDPTCPTVEAPIAVSDTELNVCEGEVNVQVFEAQVPNGSIVNWYNVAVGGTPILENSPIFTAMEEGTYYAGAMTLPDSCKSASRLAFTLSMNPLDDASFSYPSVSYCLNEVNPLPTVATPNGTFSSSGSFPINPVTGEINLIDLSIGEEYTIEYQTNGNCPNTSTFTINIIEDNLEVDAGSPISICRNDLISLNGVTLSGSPNSFEWSTNIDGNFNNPLDLLASFSPTDNSNNFYLFLTATNSCGAVYTDSVEVLITELGELNFEGATSLNLGETTQLEVTGGNDSFVWSAHPDLSCTDCANPIFTANTAGTNTLVVESEEDCILPLTINVTVNAPEPTNSLLIFPNAFSPNGDGVNDEFRAVSNTRLESFSLLIYNRWGEQVFQSSDINNAWDGSYKNKVGEIGVYAYVLQYQFEGGKPQLKRGNVTLIW
ncbi:MAG: gliding motility-associated C-terminal domain-containing protein [Chitinophagales bacterium]